MENEGNYSRDDAESEEGNPPFDSNDNIDHRLATKISQSVVNSILNEVEIFELGDFLSDLNIEKVVQVVVSILRIEQVGSSIYIYLSHFMYFRHKLNIM